MQKEAKVLDDMSVWQNKKNVKMDETMKDSDILEFHGAPDVEQIRKEQEKFDQEKDLKEPAKTTVETAVEGSTRALSSVQVASVAELSNNGVQEIEGVTAEAFNQKHGETNISINFKDKTPKKAPRIAELNELPKLSGM